MDLDKQLKNNPMHIMLKTLDEISFPYRNKPNSVPFADLYMMVIDAFRAWREKGGPNMSDDEYEKAFHQAMIDSVTILADTDKVQQFIDFVNTRFNNDKLPTPNEQAEVIRSVSAIFGMVKVGTLVTVMVTKVITVCLVRAVGMAMNIPVGSVPFVLELSLTEGFLWAETSLAMGCMRSLGIIVSLISIGLEIFSLVTRAEEMRKIDDKIDELNEHLVLASKQIFCFCLALKAGSVMTTLINVDTGNMLDCNNKREVYTHKQNGGANQKWLVLPDPTSGTVSLLSTATIYYLDSNAAGKVYTHVGNGGKYQKWFMTPIGVNSFSFKNLATGLYLTERKTAKDKVYTSKFVSMSSQMWRKVLEIS